MTSRIKPRTSGLRNLLGVAAVLALVAAACGGGASDAADEPDGTNGVVATTAAPASVLPAIALESFEDGSSVTLNDFLGKPLVVNFWASWCPSCVAEMSAAFKPAQELLGDSVTFIGVNIQDDRDKALRLLDETGVQWVSVENGDGSLWAALDGLAMPFTVFIDADGEIVDKHNGPLNESQLVDRITEKLLG
jgi:thiol-disulfide isomerase/thioredoxin